MIVTTLDKLSNQINPTANMRRAIAFLLQDMHPNLPTGKVEIDGERVYAMVQRYDNLPITDPVRLEAHHNYIDIQYIVSGEEVIGYAPLQQLTNLTEYDPKIDALFGQVPSGKITPILLKEGMLGVFYPNDAHAPKLAYQPGQPVVKVVVKVAVE